MLYQYLHLAAIYLQLLLPKMPFCFPTLHISPFNQNLAPLFRSSSEFVPQATGRPNLSRIVGFVWRNRDIKILHVINGVNSHFDPSGYVAEMKRNVVEHVLLIKAKESLSDVQEKDMLDNLYTSQYQMRGILAISLGRIEETNEDNFTHAVYMRFLTKEDLAKFYLNPYYNKVVKEHVIPYCDETITVDYESEVEDDILPIFRRGENFNHGVECIILLSTTENALRNDVEDALATIKKLIEVYQSIIVQSTQGSNFNRTDSIYTHAVVVRFFSMDSLNAFRSSSEYKEVLEYKFKPIIRKALLVYYAVDPVGSQLM